mmetsp:Transcript_5701/g.23522  ORF Transcript_5701/g.23522 Transcript_5701/m.23522 type:complete len:1185 (+) Transcript_5701:1625-5179(+)
MPWRTNLVLDTLDAVLDLHVEVAKALDVLLRSLPVTAPVRLQEVGNHLAEGVRVGLHEPLLHLGILHVHVVGILVHPVVHLTGGGGPAEGVVEALLNLARALVARSEHALVPLGVEQLGAGVQAHRLGERAHLGVRGGGVRDERRGHLTILAHAGDKLGGVRVKVVRHVGEGNLGRVEVLEGDVNLGEGRLEDVGLGLHARAGGVRVEREGLAVEVHLLELGLIVPRGVLDGEVHVGRVGTGRVGEDAGGSLADGETELLGLFDGVLAHEVHVVGFVLLGGELDGAVEKVHLVDEEIAEDAGAVDDDVDAGAAELFEGDELELVHAAEGVGHGADADHEHHLREGLAVGLDVVGAPEHERDGLRVYAAVLHLLALDEAIDDNLGGGERGGGRDRLGVERVDVLAGGENLGVADGVTTGAGEDILAVESLDERAELVILDDLLEAEAEVVEELAGGDDVDVLELGGVEGVAPGHRDGGAAEHVAEGAERVCGEAARGVGRAGDKGADHRAGRLGDVLEELHLGELALVVGAVDALDVVADGAGEELGKREDLLILAIDAGDVDEGGDSLLRGGRATDNVEAAGEEARLDLHQLLVNLTDDHVALVLVEILGVLLLRGELLDVLVEVALDRGGDDGVDDGHAAAGVLQALVGRDELLELLETLVQTGVLGGRGQVGDGVGVGAALGNGSLGRVVGGVVVDVRGAADEVIGVAIAGHANLLTGHELQGAVGAEMEHGVGAEHLLDVGVVRRKSVVGRGGLGEEEAHGIALVAEGGLDADEDVAELLAVHEEVLAVGVEVAGGRAPVLVKVLLVDAELLVLLDGHLVLDVHVGRGELGLLVVENGVDEVLLGLGQVTDVVALLLEALEHAVDGAKHVEVRGRADVALVRGEGEDGDGELLVNVLLLAKVGPLHGARGDLGRAILEGVRFASLGVAAGEDDGLEAAVELGKRNLERNLHGVKAEGGIRPLLGGLERQGHGHHVGHVELLEGVDSLGVVLASGTADERKAGEGQDGVDKGILGDGVEEEALDRDGEVEAAREHGHHLGAAGLELHHHARVVALIAGDKVRALEDEADNGGVLGEGHVLAGVVPVEVLLEVLVHGRRGGVPDADVGERLGLGNLHLHVLERGDVRLGDHEEEVLEVVRAAAEPVLQGVHEVAGVLGLVGGEVLEHLGEGAHELEHALLEAT